MKKYTLAAVIAAILAAQGVMAQPQMGGKMQRGPGQGDKPSGMRGGDGIGMLMRVSRDVELQKQAGITEDEAAKLQALATKVQRDMIDLKATKEKAELDLKAIMDGKNPDREAAMAAADALAAAQAAFMKANVGAQLDVVGLIGAEKVDALQDACRATRMDMRKKSGRDSKMWKGKKDGKGRGPKGECPRDDDKDDDDDQEENDD